jgi:archaeosine synthase
MTNIVKNYATLSLNTKSQEEIEASASYQFGRNIAKKLLKNTEIKGKYPYRKIMENKKQIAMISEERGFISLTLKGAEKIAEFKKYFVKIHDDFEIKGSILAPGIYDADKKIRIGDEVIIIKNNKLTAVGIAQMNGATMIKSSYGEAVKIRHKG